MSYNSILASAPLTTQNYHLKMIGTTIGNSLIWDNGTNVGIGNTNTTYTLDVTGTGRFTGDLTVNTLTIGKGGGNLSNNTALGYNVLVGNTTGNYNVGVGTNALSSLGTGSNNTVIGYTAGISIYSGSNNTIVGIYAGSSTLSNNIILADGAGNIKFQYDGSKTIIGQSNNVLIGGSTDSGYKLDVTGTGRFKASDSQLTLAHSGGTYSTVLVTNSIGNFYVQPNGSFNALTIASTGAATFSSSVTAGGFVVGVSGTYKVVTDTNTTLGYLIRSGSWKGSSENMLALAAETGYGISLFTNGLATERMTITSGGNVGIGTIIPTYQLQLSTDSAAKPTSALWTIASDERIKENINPYKKGLQELLKINPITYDYNGLGGFVKGKGGVGIIAQEIIDILPDSVSSIKAKLNETDEDETNILNFNGHELIYVLINSIKEQQATITSLQDRITKAGL